MFLMAGMKIGYARVSTNDQDLTVQRNALLPLVLKRSRSLSTTDLQELTGCAPDSVKRWRHAELAIRSW